MRSCPEKQSILNYLLGKSPDGQMRLLEDHFARCNQCEETLRGIRASDTLTELVGSAVQTPTSATPEDQAFVEALINQLQNQETVSRANGDRVYRIGLDWNKRNDRNEIESANEIVRLVAPSDRPDCLGRLGVYHLESILGAGSTSVVFLAMDQELNRKVALKVLRPSLGSAAKERFINEAQSVAAIEHSNVVTIYQVGVENDLAFIAMKWVPGETLEQRFSQVAFLPEAEVVEIAKQITAGLIAAHQQQMIHRDIKPANIWLSAEQDQVTILDFGLARIADDDPQMTQTGVLAGTPNFMSPEQARGIELDSRSDLFGLGCLMYRAATGKLPFEGNGVLSTLQAIQNAEPPAPVTLNPHLTSDFSDLLMSLLEKQPANRPASAQDLLDAFEQPREQWKFGQADGRGQPDAAVPHDKKRASGAVSSGWTRWISIAVALVLFAFAGFFMGPDVIRIATNQGELIIQTEDEAVKIEVLSHGKIVKVIDTQTDQAINIKSGRYEFQVANSQNGFKVTPQQIEMTRGGRRIVVISRTDKPQSQTTAATLKKERVPKAPTFDGRTFDQWSAILKTERNPLTIKMGLKALAQLSDDDPQLTERAIQTVIPILRKHGSLTVTGDKDELVGELNLFFGHLEPEQLIQIIIQEVKSGTEQSLSHLAWLVMPTAVYGRQPKQIPLYRQAVFENIQKLISAASGLIQSADLAKATAGEHLLQSSIKTAFGPINVGFQTQAPISQMSEQVERTLKKLLHDSRSSREKILYTELLVRYNRVDRRLIESVVELIEDEKLSGHVGYVLHSELLPNIPKKFARPLVQPIVNLIQHQEKIERISHASINATFGIATAESVRAGLIELLGTFGAASEPVLSWLDKTAAGDDLLSKRAKAAATAIRRELQKNLESKPTDQD